MASSKGDGGSEGKKDGKRGVTRMRKLHKAKSKGVKYEVTACFINNFFDL